MPSVLITGANRGIGLELTRLFAADGWRVYACCRKPDAADNLRQLAGNITLHGLSLGETHPGSVAALARRLEGEPIDVLLNNAGVYGPRDYGIGSFDYEAWDEVLRVNALAPMMMAERFLENVLKSQQKKVVSVSSIMGSLASTTSGGGTYIYRSSKACLNMAMRCFAGDTGAQGVTSIVIHPGWVRTDMGGPSAAIDPVESATGIKKVIEGLGTEDNGKFFNYDGNEIPW